jgi:hypothetical protein
MSSGLRRQNASVLALQDIKGWSVSELGQLGTLG